jgi:hypothetical protein
MKFFGIIAFGLAVATSAEPIGQRAAVCNDKRPDVCSALGLPVGKRADDGFLAARANPTACNANNCARAVTGTREGKVPAVTSRQADCSSFMKATAYTYANGATATVISPTAVPAYASPCSSPVNSVTAYASACSCWGITATTTKVSTAAPACTVSPGDAVGNPKPAFPCAGGYEGLCYCAADTAGKPFCDAAYFGGDFIHSLICATDSQCPTGYACNKFWKTCDRIFDNSYCLA